MPNNPLVDLMKKQEEEFLAKFASKVPLSMPISVGQIFADDDKVVDFLRSSHLALLTEMQRMVEKGVRRKKSVLTTQGFTTPTCLSCQKKFSWHNGNPPPVCKECGENIEIDGYNKALSDLSRDLTEVINEMKK